MGMLHEQQSHYEHASHAPQSASVNDVENPLRRTTSDGRNDYLHFSGSAPLKRSMDSSDSRVTDDSTASSYSSITPDSTLFHPSTPPSTEYVLNVAFYSFVGFMTVQAIFAYIAKSQAMMADCEAMMVDAVTYLLNLVAEHYKHRPLTEYELSLPLQQRLYRRELQRHCLEFIPPTISVITLILVTIYTLQDSIATLLAISIHGATDDSDDVSAPIMFALSFANLILDILNVTCFTRSGFSVMEWMSACRKDANSATTSAAEMVKYHPPEEDESSPLLNAPLRKQVRSYSSSDEEDEVLEEHSNTEVNLNMCSAWTVRSISRSSLCIVVHALSHKRIHCVPSHTQHVCADTLRSTAVLIAASVALCIPSSYVHASDMADAVAALAVSVIILCTLIPLIQGLVRTAGHIVRLLRQKDERRQPPSMVALITV
jgi:Co/Zn/Cd efflux system component